MYSPLNARPTGIAKSEAAVYPWTSFGSCILAIMFFNAIFLPLFLKSQDSVAETCSDTGS